MKKSKHVIVKAFFFFKRIFFSAVFFAFGLLLKLQNNRSGYFTVQKRKDRNNGYEHLYTKDGH